MKRKTNTPMIATTPLTRRFGKQEGESLDYYFKDLNRYMPVSASEEQELFKRYRAGDISAKKKIIQANLRFVIKVAQRYMGQGVPFSDLISEGNKGLIYAVDKFDPDKNFKFISYAVWWIRHTILIALSVQSRIVSIPLNQTQRIITIGKSFDKLLQKGGCVPTDEEIAKDTGLPLETTRALMQTMLPAVSMDSKIDCGSGVLTVADTLVSTDENALDVLLARSTEDNLYAAIKSLSKIEKIVIEKFYGFRGEYQYTLDEIGKTLGLSRERIRQIRNKACEKIKYYMTGVPEVSHG